MFIKFILIHLQTTNGLSYNGNAKTFKKSTLSDFNYLMHHILQFANMTVLNMGSNQLVISIGKTIGY